MSSQLQILSEQFNSLLNEYSNTYQDYMNAINTNDTSLINIPNSSFIGQTNISVTSNSSQDDCNSSCTSNNSCVGATFNNSTNECTLGSGDGDVLSDSNSTTSVRSVIYYGYKLKTLNDQLLNLNQQMSDLVSNDYQQYKQNKQQSKQQEDLLNNNYQALSEDREKINIMMNEFKTLNSAYDSENINLTANYYSYILLLIVAIILIVMLMNVSSNFSSQQRGGGNKNNNFFVIVILFLSIIIFNSLK